MNPATEQQNAPTPNQSPSIWQLVLLDMAERERFGISKYGTPVQAGNGRDALVDAYQEALDLCVYLRQAIEERKTQPHKVMRGFREIIDLVCEHMVDNPRIGSVMFDGPDMVEIRRTHLEKEFFFLSFGQPTRIITVK